MAGSSAGRIDLDLELNYGAFRNQLSSIAGTANGLVGSAFKGLGGIIAGAFAVGGLVSFGREAINLASDLQEVQNVVDVTFGGMAQDINNWSSSLIESFGLSELAGKKYASTMGAMLKSSGLAGTQMESMSKDLTELAADVASFYNLSNDEAYQKVFSGMTGETEPLKALGINMSVANMEAFALSQGIDKAWLSMTQAEQTMLRYNYLMQVTADAQGDFARTSNSWANQVKIMGEQWKIFQGTMGAGFINILTPVLRGLNWLITKLQTAAAYFKAFTELIFGDAAGGSSTAAASAISSVGTAATDTADAVSGVSDATDEVADSTKKASKAVKGSLAGFDQLNTLAKSTSDALDSTSDAAGGIDLGSSAGVGDIDLGTADINVDPVKQKVQSLIDGIKSSFAGAWSYIAAGWAGMRPALQPFVDMLEPISKSVQGIGATFKDLQNKVLVPMAKYTLGNFIPQLVAGFTKSFAPVIADQITWAFAEFDKTFRNVTDTASKLWTTVWLPNLELVKNAFLLAMPAIAASLSGLLTGAINPFMDFMMNDFATPLNAALTETLVPLFSSTLAWAVLEFAKTSQTAVAAIVDLWSGTFLPALTDLRDVFLDVIPQMGGSLQDLLNGTIKPFVDYALNDFIIPISKAILETLVPILSDTLVWAFKEVANTFEWAVKLINDIYKTVFKPVFDLIKEIVLDTLQIVKDAWDKYGTAILDKLSDVMDDIRDTFQRLWDDMLKPIIIPFLDALKDVWEGTLKGIVEQVVDLVLKLVDAAADIYNKFISPIVNYLIQWFAPTFVNSFKTVLTIVTTVVKGIGEVISDLLSALSGVIDFVAGVFTGDWGRAWEGVKTIFKGVFDSLVDIVKIPLNLIIDGINSLIKGLNSIKIDMPGWVEELTGYSSFGINIPSIPHLAKGGLAYGPTLAMVGDNKGAAADPEVVSPLSTLQGMLDTTNQATVAVLQQILSALSGDKTTVIKIGETELGRASINAINNVQRQAGQTLLIT